MEERWASSRNHTKRTWHHKSKESSTNVDPSGCVLRTARREDDGPQECGRWFESVARRTWAGRPRTRTRAFDDGVGCRAGASRKRGFGSASDRRGQAPKGTGGMPRRHQDGKRGRLRNVRGSCPTSVDPGILAETRGTETSQYPEEKKSTETPSVAASERGPA